MPWGMQAQSSSGDLPGQGLGRGLLFMVRKVSLRMQKVSPENQPTAERWVWGGQEMESWSGVWNKGNSKDQDLGSEKT